MLGGWRWRSIAKTSPPCSIDAPCQTRTPPASGITAGQRIPRSVQVQDAGRRPGVRHRPHARRPHRARLLESPRLPHRLLGHVAEPRAAGDNRVRRLVGLGYVERVECLLVDELEHLQRLTTLVDYRDHGVALLTLATTRGPHAAPLLQLVVRDLDLLLGLEVEKFHCSLPGELT